MLEKGFRFRNPFFMPHSSMKIRTYHSNDKVHVIEVFRANVPAYFDPSEQQGLEHYLGADIEDYYVVEYLGRIIGAGGINYEANKAILSWDFIHPEHQGKGVGTLLTQHRLDYIRKEKGLRVVEVRTSQLTDRFYARFGFILLHKEEDYWSVGYHLYHMRLEL